MHKYNTLIAWAWAALASGALAAPPRLHVPSPDWRDQIIYFVVTDRFANGEPGNDDQHAGEFNAGSAAHYNGGDLRGLLQRLDYIAGLGATALWITPPVANQWLTPSGSSAGYHGYWAENLMQVDRHLGTLDDLRALSRALHGRGMYLVQDIVVNHLGDYFHIRPDGSFVAQTNTPPVPRPSQSPFDRNDARDAAQRRQGIYHWTADITDYADPTQLLTLQMSGLDDLDTENPEVRRALRLSYGYWLREAGVDALRVDTAFYVPPAFFADFLHAPDAAAPGVQRVARATGRRDLLVFGEGFAFDARADDDTAMRRIARYMAPDALPSMLNFPLYAALNDVFARGRPPAELARRIERMVALFPQLHRMPSFVDNHDVDRFLAGASPAALRQALLALMTLPGIPVIYYGTEQGFTQQRAAMFAGGYGAGGVDHYDRGAPLYRAIAAMAALRSSHRALTRGTPDLLAAQPGGPGAIAWRMQYGGESLLVVFNTAEHETLLPALALGARPGTVFEGLYGLDGLPGPLVADAQGRATLTLPPRAGRVWRLTPRRAPVPVPVPEASPLTVQIDGHDDAGLHVSGQAPPGPVRLVLDGDLRGAATVQADADGRWQARVDTAAFIDPAQRHELVAWAGSASPPRPFSVQREWHWVADVADPAGDDRGPSGSYRYPDSPGYGAAHPADLRRVRVATAGGALRIEITPASISTRWNPAHGFDHVAFTVFIELPGQPGGATVMPGQHASLPGGMRWHRRLRVHGWSNALFDAAGASATNEGTPITPGAGLQVEGGRITLTLARAALGGAALAGARIYVSSWDYDGGFRALSPEGGPYVFGGAAADAPKLMDDSAVITLAP